MIRSCIQVVDQSVQSKLDSIDHSQDNSTQTESDPNQKGFAKDGLKASQRKRAIESEVYTDKLKRRMIHDELTGKPIMNHQQLALT